MFNNSVAIIFLFFVTGTCAMDLEMVTVKSRKFNKVPVELQIKNWPIELRAKVAENIIDLCMHEHENTKECIYQKRYETWTLNKLLLGIEYAQEFHQLQKICDEKKIGGKKFLAQELFSVQRKYRDILFRLANPSMMQRWIGYNIEVDDYRKFMGMEDENIKRGLQLTILNGSKIGHLIVALLCFNIIGSSVGIGLSIRFELFKEAGRLMVYTWMMSGAGIFIMDLLKLPEPIKVWGS